MNIKTYQQKAARTCATLGTLTEDSLHMVLGMHTESAEIADVYKKALAYKKPVDFVNVKEELGDLMWYVANMCNIHGWALEDILDTNIAKLEARYPEKFTEDLAINRNLEAEREILETGGIRTVTSHVKHAIFPDGESV